MQAVASALYTEFASGAQPLANVRLLVSATPVEPWQCRWTEAVQLRNPDGDGKKRPPLLLLVPPGTELLGSLDADTFRTIGSEDIVRDVITSQLALLPDTLAVIRDLIRRKEITTTTSDLQRVRYLLTLGQNGYTQEAAGLALCLLGLWPHRNWLAQQNHEFWFSRNREIVKSLRSGTISLLDRVYRLELESDVQARRLYSLFSASSSFEAAMERVATDALWSDLELGSWKFAARPDTVVITLDPLVLPRHQDGAAVLRLRDQPNLALKWSVQPTPNLAPSMTHYQVELLPVAGDSDTVAYASETIPTGSTARKSFTLKGLGSLVKDNQLPEDLYRLRVTAWSRQTNITAVPSAGEEPTNLSERFWILDEGDSVDAAPSTTQREQRVDNRMQARRLVQWDLLKATKNPWSIPEPILSWDGGTDSKATQSTCSLRFGRHTFRIELSSLLRRLETDILTRPEKLGAIRADLSNHAQSKDVPVSFRDDLPILSDDDPFAKARATLFACLRGADGHGLVETADLVALADEIRAYAREYVALLRDAEREVTDDPQRWRERAGLAAIDTVRLALPGLTEESHVALLLAPTHPIRLLWSLQLALLGDAWLNEAYARGTIEAMTGEMRDALQGGLQPVHLPEALFDRRRVGFLQAGSIAPGWDAYLPADIADKPLALARLARALGCGARGVGDATCVQDLGDRILRYVRQHPYIGLLRLNVFNPGDGTLITKLLNKLDVDLPALRYDIRLFTPEAAREDIGAALDQLVNPETTVSEAAEKYSQAAPHRLYPILSYSKNHVSEFLQAPEKYPAHLSLLLEMFRPGLEVTAPLSETPVNDLHGLVREQTIAARVGQGAFAWERQVAPGSGPEIAADQEGAALLRETLRTMDHFLAALGVSPSAREGKLPTVRLDLTVAGQNLLYEVHRISDWVLTYDRHLGIEYFDTATQGKDRLPGILLDFAPEFPQSDPALLMLTTRVGDEIEHLVTPALAQLAFHEPETGLRIVEWLRSLSGRLAMRLLAAPTASQGVFGMALARAFLERLDLLNDTIIIPVDAHVALLKKGSTDAAPQLRTDLILVRRIPTTRQIEFTLIEVKCKAGTLTASAFQSLREEIEAQVNQTQSALANLFDPNHVIPDRLDRPLRNLLLARWLRFYVGRARRYGLLGPDAEQAFHSLLSTLQEGFTVNYRQLGLVFELGQNEDKEDASGQTVIHRIGRATCERLLRATPGEEPTPPMSWDRVRANVRGNEVWVRTPQRSEEAQSETGNEKTTGTLTLSRGNRPNTPVTDTAMQETPDGLQQAEATVSVQIEAIQTDGEVSSAEVPPEEIAPTLTCHYLVGAPDMTPQWGLLGKHGAETVALDLNGCNTMSLFGVQGGGKSYTMGSILEMALRPLPGLNHLVQPLAAVVFHYNASQDYPPEFVTMANPNRAPIELETLRREYGASGHALNDILILTSEDKVEARQREFPGLPVEPILFHPSELTIQDWRFLMGAVGNDSLYVRELGLIMRGLRNQITVEGLRDGIENGHLAPAQQNLARLRLRFAEQFVRDSAQLRNKLYPGRLIIVDLRDELIDTDEALGLFVVLLRVFAGALYQGKSFNKWIAFDEAHKYIRNPDLVESVVEVIRQMRHQATSVLIASQDPPSLPLKIVELSSLVMLHRMDSPAWLKHIQRAVTPLADLTPMALASLRPGEAFLWARAATSPLFTRRAVKILCRPRATQHGGATRTATDAT
jgi:hypothetical protein